MAKRIRNTIFGGINYFTIGLAIFVLVSALWDLSSRVAWVRSAIVIASVLIIFLAIVMNRTKLSTLKSITTKQMGA